MRKIACAFNKDTGELEPLSTTDELKSDHTGCPLAALLPHLRGESFDTFFSALVERGMLRLNKGHFEFVELPGPCPYVQAQQMEDKEHG